MPSLRAAAEFESIRKKSAATVVGVHFSLEECFGWSGAGRSCSTDKPASPKDFFCFFQLYFDRYGLLEIRRRKGTIKM